MCHCETIERSAAVAPSGRGHRKPVYSDRPGEWWLGCGEAAAYLRVCVAMVSDSARSGGRHACRGRYLSYEPPEWAKTGPLPPPRGPGDPGGYDPEADGRRVKRELWSDRTGENWPNASACAEALGVPRSTLVARLDAGLPVAGRVLYEEPPAWALAERESVVRKAVEREPRRIAAIRVRAPKVHMGNGYGPGGKWYGTGGNP